MPVHLEEHICVRVNAYKQIVWVNRSLHNWPWFLTLYPKIARNSPTPRRARLCEHQRTAVAQLSAITDNQERSERFRSARNRKSHLGFEVQKQVSSGEKFKSNVPFLTEQFPAPVQGIQISVIIPDTTNQFFLLFVMFPQWERDYVRQQRLQKMEEKCRGRVNELATVRGMVSFYELTSNDNATDAQRKAGRVWYGLILEISRLFY